MGTTDRWAFMQLSRELFNQIIAHLKGGRDGIHNKRREPRVGLRNRVALTPLKGSDNSRDRASDVAVRDLSRDGIGFLHHKRLPVNTLFTISLPALDDGELTAVYRVKHCESLDEGLYRIGGSLINLCEANEKLVPAEEAKPAAAPAGAKGSGPMAARRARSADAA